MIRSDLLEVIEPISGFSVLNKYQLPWVWFGHDGQALYATFSDGGSVVAQCTSACAGTPFLYKLNGSMLLRAIKTFGPDDEISLKQVGQKLVLKSGRIQSEMPTYDPGTSIPSVMEPASTPNVVVDQADMIRLVKFARSFHSNLCFRKEGTAGCYTNTSVYTCGVTSSNIDILLPEYVIQAMDYLGESVAIHAIDNEYAIIGTGNMAVMYKHDRYTDYKLDRRVREEVCVDVGVMNTPNFANFRACGAKELLWDNSRNVVKQYNVSELMYEEVVDGVLEDYFITPLIPDLGAQLKVQKLQKWPTYLFNFGDSGLFAVSQISP